ncbi:hypothetical protein Nepgr_021001 [Nepenthes gracilis]|uniref:Uncharacterized protein n=1 Tax=Nepenthes gracilis TaxID=150966 RepID=A0AAD3SWC1_NEPGR|nr:hypothetical protein Nepgr_021001 [Nepenthes gracilis]
MASSKAKIWTGVRRQSTYLQPPKGGVGMGLDKKEHQAAKDLNLLSSGSYRGWISFSSSTNIPMPLDNWCSLEDFHL